MINWLISIVSAKEGDTITSGDPRVISIDQVKFADGHTLNDVLLVVGLVINAFIVFAGTFAIIYFIYSGILYITSAGNPDNVKKGQMGMINAAIGIVIVVLAYYIVTAVASYAGIVPGS